MMRMHGKQNGWLDSFADMYHIGTLGWFHTHIYTGARIHEFTKNYQELDGMVWLENRSIIFNFLQTCSVPYLTEGN